VNDLMVVDAIFKRKCEQELQKTAVGEDELSSFSLNVALVIIDPMLDDFVWLSTEARQKHP